MTKIKNINQNTKPVTMNVELIDTDREADHVTYLYALTDMEDDEPLLKAFVYSFELLRFVKDSEMNETAMPDDEFFLDVWNEVVDKYWSETMLPKLEKKVEWLFAPSNLGRAV